MWQQWNPMGLGSCWKFIRLPMKGFWEQKDDYVLIYKKTAGIKAERMCAPDFIPTWDSHVGTLGDTQLCAVVFLITQKGV